MGMPYQDKRKLLKNRRLADFWAAALARGLAYRPGLMTRRALTH